MKLSRTICLALVVLAVYWSYKSLMPSYKADNVPSGTSFSVNNALEHVKKLSVQPHAVGFPGHSNVRAYIVGELNKLGLTTSTQEGYTFGEKWGNMSKATNILAKIEGQEEGKALLLLSHYDSSPHSSYGASDAGSGVATILEGVRAFLAEGKKPKNDIIILISDAEETGLNGANLFVNKHPWAKDVGLVLNFEARGSGGPSYMLIETNRGNRKMIEEFTKANPEYPVTNSLAYSIYKMLPNDTDLTVFREDRDIEGFNFAFIDDHYDYHTALDKYERLDRKSLAHQGSYLMPLLNYYGMADLSDMKSLDDYVYFNFPFFKLVSYPFDWIWPMFILALTLFAVLLVIGFRKKVLDVKSILTGFIPLLIILLFSGCFGHFSWPILKWWYPGYEDMLHGFTYNGHSYIIAFAFFILSTCFFVYNRFRKISTPNILVAPIFLWLIICALTAQYLKGASFFVIPLYGLLAAFLVTINQEKPNPFVLLFLAVPAIFVYSPFITMFPVGLGLKMMIAATLLVALLYVLVLPLFAQSKNQLRFSIICLFLFAVVSISAHLNSTFSDKRPKPSSLLYVYDDDTKNAMWATYDNVLIGWNSQFLDNKEKAAENGESKILSSKYATGFSYVSKAPIKQIDSPDIAITHDTIVNDKRSISLCVTPRRNINRLEVLTNDVVVSSASINGIGLSDHYLKNRKNQKLITHYVSDNDYTEIEMTVPKEEKLELSFYEASNDLLTNKQFSVPKRPKNSIPMPFVLNDAILVLKKIRFD